MPIQTRTSDPNVTVSTYDPAVLEYLYPEWPALDSRAKLALIREARGDVARTSREQMGNVVTLTLRQYLAKSMDPEHDSTNRKVAAIALGTDGASGTSALNDDLNNRVEEVDVTDTVYTAATAELHVMTFVDSTQANGEIVDEVGVLADNGDLWNHATFTAIEKTNVKTIVVDVYFTIA